MNKFIILALVLVSAVVAQQPVPCTTPPQWEARVFVYDVSQQYQRRAHLAYDALYKRQREVEERILGTDNEYLDILRLYNQNIEYVYSFKNGTCTKQTPSRPWRDYNVPANATSLGEAFIGSSAVPNANVLTNLWTGNTKDGEGNNEKFWGAWTNVACLPVATTYDNSKYGLIHSFVFDIVPGIADKDAFVPRPECNKTMTF